MIPALILGGDDVSIGRDKSDKLKIERPICGSKRKTPPRLYKICSWYLSMSCGSCPVNISHKQGTIVRLHETICIIFLPVNI